MAIFRGIGGAGDSTTDASLTAITEQAINAANSATSAYTSANEAAVSASEAATSATNAATSETNAASSASTASTAATDAATSASAAYTSATNAATSASAAAASELVAAASETAAAGSASTATTKATEASSSASAAASSASYSADSATASANSATAALASQNAASNSASAASTSATNAATSESNAASSAAAAADSYDSFDDRYLGAKPLDPTVDNDGDALLTGALYFNTSSNIMKIYTGSSWLAAYATLGGALINANNLSDVTDASVSRSNLGVGTTDNVVFNSLETTDGLIVGGSLTVNGTLTTVNTENLAVSDNMIYLNEGSTITNPDLGWSGNYNDGTYAHAGIFRDATDGVFKFYEGYTLEPGVEINTGDASFTLADVAAGSFTGPLIGNASTATALETSRTIGLTGDVSGSTTFDGTSDVTITAFVADDSHNHSISTVTGLQSSLDEKAPLASPSFTGTPEAPTAAVSTNTTQVATTAFVNAQIANDAPTKTGGDASGTWNIDITGNAATASNGGVTSVNGETGAVTITIPSAFDSGTTMLFVQTAAPTGWTKSTTHDNKALRIVSGTAGTGGTRDFTTAFGSAAVSGTVGGTVGSTSLTEAQMPAHDHYTVRNAMATSRSQYSITTTTSNYLAGAGSYGYETYYLNGHSSVANTGLTSLAGSGSGHTHSFTGTLSSATANINVYYVDAIIAVKD